MFKKRNPIKISGKWNYYPQRSIENEPITIDDKMRVMSPSRESGSEYLKKHLNFINNSLERDFVARVISQMSDESDAIFLQASPGIPSGFSSAISSISAFF